MKKRLILVSSLAILATAGLVLTLTIFGRQPLIIKGDETPTERTLTITKDNITIGTKTSGYNGTYNFACTTTTTSGNTIAFTLGGVVETVSGAPSGYTDAFAQLPSSESKSGGSSSSTSSTINLPLNTFKSVTAIQCDYAVVGRNAASTNYPIYFIANFLRQSGYMGTALGVNTKVQYTQSATCSGVTITQDPDPIFSMPDGEYSYYYYVRSITITYTC